MAKRAGAGSLNCRLTFQRREQISDEWGGTRGEWVDQFTVPGRLEPRYGSNAESVMAARMQSMQPYNLTIRGSTAARQITASWRAYDARAGKTGEKPNRVFGIKTVVNPDERNAYLEMLVVEGEET
ncbi:head-tail adaptor protein [Ochrobactrum sp. 695/2009]|nr:head-tail adaptor protein [Brucella intermedia]PJR89956.1 head-tail adaptor protein [Ochrobactrum sp. 721/2009]PJT14173.1 head-tail adaptor protein [Ochrobactrum sp. 720/2009]PJT24342.1 head-tail adaptor protein [Ochrobactrum sp. 715/2009]PJT30333.1 head-tail adaptor protein [Ochrobactrum sp. 695/2009]PJT33860.1 head-tail adaptor protein [Ochrobactrum sp. 689/2009]